jgi:hypothetical protein
MGPPGLVDARGACPNRSWGLCEEPRVELLPVTNVVLHRAQIVSPCSSTAVPQASISWLHSAGCTHLGASRQLRKLASARMDEIGAHTVCAGRSQSQEVSTSLVCDFPFLGAAAALTFSLWSRSGATNGNSGTSTRRRTRSRVHSSSPYAPARPGSCATAPVREAKPVGPDATARPANRPKALPPFRRSASDS